MNLLGVDLLDLPDGYTAVEVASVVKCLNDEGDPVYVVRASDGVSSVEAMGMFDAGRAVMLRDVESSWEEG